MGLIQLGVHKKSNQFLTLLVAQHLPVKPGFEIPGSQQGQCRRIVGIVRTCHIAHISMFLNSLAQKPKGFLHNFFLRLDPRIACIG